MTHFYSCDWGTSSFRLRLVSWPWLAVLAEVRTDEGVRQVAANCQGCSTEEAYADVLQRHLRELQRQQGQISAETPVVISGMVSSSIGWRELPYAQVPFHLDARDVEAARLPAERPLWLLSGLRTETDVIRGEETELLGIFDKSRWRDYAADCVVVMSGTHAKHVRLQDQAVSDFRTFMTGELYEVLGCHTILRHSLPEAAGPWGEREEAAFRQGVETAAVTALTQALFTVRTSSLFEQRQPAENGAFLSGLLIGLEVHDLQRRHPDTPVLIAAGTHQFHAYELAFATVESAQPPVLIRADVVDAASIRGQAVFLKHQEVL